MNILLTGGTGYIGSHTALVLLEAGHQPVLFDNFCNSSADVVTRLARISGQTLPLVTGDVRDTRLLVQTLDEYRIDAVIHFAGLKAVGESVAKPVDYYANNVQGSISLLQAMQASAMRTRTLVFSSSATVYGDPQYLPFDEAHPLNPANPYGRSKWQAEQVFADLAAADPDWRIACLRYFNPVGAHKSGLIGEDPNGLPNNLMPYIAQVACGQLPCLNVFGDDYPTPDGTGVRDYIHVMDLAAGHLAAIGFLARTTGWHGINLGTGQGRSVLEVIHAFEMASGQPLPYRIAPRRPGDIAAYYACPDKAQQLLGWQARHTLHDMCASTWHWQQYRRSLLAD